MFSESSHPQPPLIMESNSGLLFSLPSSGSDCHEMIQIGFFSRTAILEYSDEKCDHIPVLYYETVPISEENISWHYALT